MAGRYGINLSTSGISTLGSSIRAGMLRDSGNSVLSLDESRSDLILIGGSWSLGSSERLSEFAFSPSKRH